MSFNIIHRWLIVFYWRCSGHERFSIKGYCYSCFARKFNLHNIIIEICERDSSDPCSITAYTCPWPRKKNSVINITIRVRDIYAYYIGGSCNDETTRICGWFSV